MSHLQSSEPQSWVGRAVRLTAANIRDHQTGQLVPVWTRGLVCRASYSHATGREILVVRWDSGVTCPVYPEDVEILTD